MVKRGGWIWVLAILFRVQSDVLGGRTSLGQLLVLDIVRGNTLKVDILNVMGPAIAGAAVLWGLARTPRWRIAGSIAAASAFAFATPGIRAWAALDALPDALEGYLRPFAGRTTFSFFPWAGFVFAGAAIGVLIDRTRDAASERRLIAWFGAGGVALWILSAVSAHGPSLFGPSDFWRTAPSFFFLRVGVMVAGIAACYLWEARPRLLGADPFSPMRQFGVTSLFVYWIHVEMVYGGLSRSDSRPVAAPHFARRIPAVSDRHARVVAVEDRRRETFAGASPKLSWVVTRICYHPGLQAAPHPPRAATTGGQR